MKAFVSRILKVLCLTLPLAGCAASPDIASPLDGPPVANLGDGDLIFPRFSPNGRTLAYSEVVVGDEGETTRLLLYDFETGKTSVLLDEKEAMEYGVYSSFVTDLRWRDDQYLEATLHDGDVGLTWQDRRDDPESGGGELHRGGGAGRRAVAGSREAVRRGSGPLSGRS